MVKNTKPKIKKVEAPSVVAEVKEKKLYNVIFFYNWCKACGLCSALCPKKIIKPDPLGSPYIDDMDTCIGCRFCEIHCPDFAITIKDRHPERRRSDDSQ